MRLIKFLQQGAVIKDIDSKWNQMSVNERTDYIKNDLLKRGYTPNQTAAILGNLLQENRSLGTNTQNTSSGALGIAQWLGSRKKDIIAKGQHSSITGQLDFLDQEIKGKGAWTNNVGGKNSFFNSDNLEHLTQVFRKDFERPGEHEANDARRIKNAYSVLGQNYTGNIQSFGQSLPEDIKSNLSWEGFKTIAKSNPSILGIFNGDTQKQFTENIQLENERLQQEQIKSQVEYENQQIQMALQQKQQQREQILSMVPQAQSVNSGQIKAMFKEGGKIRNMFYAQAGGSIDSNGKRIYDKEAQKNFLNAVIFEKQYLQGNKIRERIQKSGLNVDDELDRLNTRLNDVKAVVDESSSNTNGALYNEPSDEIRYSYSSPLNINRDTMSHEVGHIFGRSNIRYSNYIDDRNGLIEEDRFGKAWQKLKLLTSSDYRSGEGHEADWQELVADVHSAREDLRNTGYDGRFSNFTNQAYNDMRRIAEKNPNSAAARIFNKIGPSESIKYRSMKSYYNQINPNEVPKEHKDFMKDYENNKQKYEDTQKRYIFDVMNKIVSNENQDETMYAQKGGKVVSEIWKEKTGTDWNEAKRRGLTDGSYQQNIDLLNRLKSNDPELMNTSPQQEVIQQAPQARMTFQDLPENFIPEVETDKEYYAWVKGKEAVTDSNTSLKNLEREGQVQLIKGEDNKIKTDENGNYLYKILTDEYKDTFNNWIKTLNTQDTQTEQPKEESKRPEGFLSSIKGLISDIADTTGSTVDEIGESLEQGKSDVKDLFQQAYNYVDRHYLDDKEVDTKKIVAAKKVDKYSPIFNDQINMTDIEVGKGKAASGIINLNSNKFVSRNRGDYSDVKGGKGIALTLFRPMETDLDKSYKNFGEVLALKKNGNVEIMSRDQVNKKNVSSITGADRMPWDQIEVVNRNGKDYVKVESSPDFKGKVVSMGGYNSGLGVGKTDDDYVPIEAANKYSKLIGGKIIIKSGKDQVLVTGSFKDMYDAYKTLEKKTGEKPVVYKLDNGSFNTSYFKDDNNINAEDLREHQNRNRAGGHALILLNK